jgi:hypothetical protein
MLEYTHYIPIASALFSMSFATLIFTHWLKKRDATYLAWWAAGVFLFGVGTVTESITSLFGWSEPVFRAWYIFGALLGGAPLAQGTVYLLLKKKTADVLSIALVTVVVTASVFIMMSPINYSGVEHFRPTGKVFAWQWVRAFSPFINTYALIFLVGGAAWSARKYKRLGVTGGRVYGNVLIAVGALLPGIGGTFTRFGYTEVLYVTEFIGLVTIFFGYRMMRSATAHSVHANQLRTVAAD